MTTTRPRIFHYVMSKLGIGMQQPTLRKGFPKTLHLCGSSIRPLHSYHLLRMAKMLSFRERSSAELLTAYRRVRNESIQLILPVWSLSRVKLQILT